MFYGSLMADNVIDSNCSIPFCLIQEFINTGGVSKKHQTSKNQNLCTLTKEMQEAIPWPKPSLTLLIISRHHIRHRSADQIGFLSPGWPISTLLFELLNGKNASTYNRKVKKYFLCYKASDSPVSSFLCLAQSLDSSQCGHSPMQQLWLSKQQSLGKFALAQDYVNYHGIITSLKQAEINYLWWNECKMRK